MLAATGVVVVSVHSYMNLDRVAMTERMLAAIENPYTQIVGHPTGRLLLRRDEFAYDMEQILDAARKHGVAMECNASPERLDLKDVYLRMAKERGVRIVISTDAHCHRAASRICATACSTARRGWIEKKDVSTRCHSRNFWPRCVPSPAPNRAPKAPQTETQRTARRRAANTLDPLRASTSGQLFSSTSPSAFAIPRRFSHDIELCPCATLNSDCNGRPQLQHARPDAPGPSCATRCIATN